MSTKLHKQTTSIVSRLPKDPRYPSICLQRAFARTGEDDKEYPCWCDYTPGAGATQMCVDCGRYDCNCGIGIGITNLDDGMTKRPWFTLPILMQLFKDTSYVHRFDDNGDLWYRFKDEEWEAAECQLIQRVPHYRLGDFVLFARSAM